MNNIIYLNLENLKKDLSFVPLKSEGNDFNFTHPLDGKVEKLGFTKEYIITVDVSIIKKSLTRTNIIGFTHEGRKDESNIHVSLKDFDPRYSINKEGKTYRIEFYRENDFCGMTLIHFK